VREGGGHHRVPGRPPRRCVRHEKNYLALSRPRRVGPRRAPWPRVWRAEQIDQRWRMSMARVLPGAEELAALGRGDPCAYRSLDSTRLAMECDAAPGAAEPAMRAAGSRHLRGVATELAERERGLTHRHPAPVAPGPVLVRGPGGPAGPGRRPVALGRRRPAPAAPGGPVGAPGGGPVPRVFADGFARPGDRLLHRRPEPDAGGTGARAGARCCTRSGWRPWAPWPPASPTS
jgi:hypothetical protein